MGYKVYVKDKATRGRYEQWDRKTYKSKTSAVMAAQEGATKKYYHTKSGKKSFGKPKFQVRSTGAPQQQGFGLSSINPRKVKWF